MCWSWSKFVCNIYFVAQNSFLHLIKWKYLINNNDRLNSVTYLIHTLNLTLVSIDGFQINGYQRDSTIKQHIITVELCMNQQIIEPSNLYADSFAWYSIIIFHKIFILRLDYKNKISWYNRDSQKQLEHMSYDYNYSSHTCRNNDT